MSGQYTNYDRNAWKEMIQRYSQTHKVVTTCKIENIPCTLDDKLTVKDIGALSTNVKYIVAINTGPLIACINSITIANVKKCIQFDTYNLWFDYPNFIHCRNIQEIDQYIL